MGKQVTGMDHAYAEAHDLVELYLAGRLSESERDAFEAHYFDCATCLERLETAEGFREGMLQVAAEDIAHARLGLLAGLAAWSRGRRLALAGAFLLLLALLPSLWLANRNRALRQQLAAASTQAQRQRVDLETRLRTAELSRPREAAAQPQVNVPLFLLAAVRGGDEGRRPVSRIPLSSTAGPVILTAELATVDFPTYRASLYAGGREAWQAEGLRPDSRDTLVFLLPAGMLQPGVYRLTVEGGNRDGRWFAVAAYPFEAVRGPS